MVQVSLIYEPLVIFLIFLHSNKAEKNSDRAPILVSSWDTYLFKNLIKCTISLLTKSLFPETLSFMRKISLFILIIPPTNSFPTIYLPTSTKLPYHLPYSTTVPTTSLSFFQDHTTSQESTTTSQESDSPCNSPSLDHL